MIFKSVLKPGLAVFLYNDAWMVLKNTEHGKTMNTLNFFLHGMSEMKT